MRVFTAVSKSNGISTLRRQKIKTRTIASPMSSMKCRHNLVPRLNGTPFFEFPLRSGKIAVNPNQKGEYVKTRFKLKMAKPCQSSRKIPIIEENHGKWTPYEKFPGRSQNRFRFRDQERTQCESFALPAIRPIVILFPYSIRWRSK